MKKMVIVLGVLPVGFRGWGRDNPYEVFEYKGAVFNDSIVSRDYFTIWNFDKGARVRVLMFDLAGELVYLVGTPPLIDVNKDWGNFKSNQMGKVITELRSYIDK